MDTCAWCDKDLADYSNVGYDGPADEFGYPLDTTDCSPFMPWVKLCSACYDSYAADSDLPASPGLSE